MEHAAVEVGAVHARGLGRRFILRSADTRSLKEVILHRRLPQKHELWALRDVDVDIAPGESLGMVGANGSGKSTLLKLVAGIFRPTEGTLAVGGRVGSLLELGAGFHPDFSGVENVYLNGAIYGLKRSYIDAHLDEIIAFAELEEFAHAPVRTYSSGMYARLGFSVAVHIQPDILLLDEVLAVGDEAFQHKCHDKIWEFKRAGGTIVFVSHDSSAVERLCERAILLDQGRLAAEGPTADVLVEYRRLLAAENDMHTPSPAGVG
jgi:ABC-2 type transport system ATP-binding protein